MSVLCRQRLIYMALGLASPVVGVFRKPPTGSANSKWQLATFTDT